MPLGEAISTALKVIQHDDVELLHPEQPRIKGELLIVDLDKVRRNGKPRDRIMRDFSYPIDAVRTDPTGYLKNLTLEAQERRDRLKMDKVCCIVIYDNPKINGYKFVTRSTRHKSKIRIIKTDFAGDFISDSDL